MLRLLSETRAKKIVEQELLDVLSQDYNITITSYHGGYMECPLMRRLMYLRPSVFDNNNIIITMY